MSNQRKILLEMIRFEFVFFTLAVPYNRPAFSANASWCPHARTMLDRKTIGSQPYGIFVDRNDTVYVVSNSLGNVIVLSAQVSQDPRIILTNSVGSRSLFVTISGEIYVDNGAQGRVEMFTSTSNVGVNVMNVDGSCAGLFTDRNESIYCSLRDSHQVMRTSKKNPSGSVRIAGTGSSGQAANQLKSPRGIFVDEKLTLYVADTENNRIQRFLVGQSNGVTVAGVDASSSFPLQGPTSIVLDADGYLFLVDSNNHRLVGSDINGFRCLVGCSKTSGPAPDQLNRPRRMSFDSRGNIFVTDTSNHRVQKFSLERNSSGKMITKHRLRSISDCKSEERRSLLAH